MAQALLPAAPAASCLVRQAPPTFRTDAPPTVRHAPGAETVAEDEVEGPAALAVLIQQLAPGADATRRVHLQQQQPAAEAH